MALEHYIDESNGLFGRSTKTRASGNEDMMRTLKTIAEEWQPETFFASIERSAREVLAQHGFDDWPIKPHGIGREAAPIARDANSVLGWLRAIRDQIAACDSSEAAALIARNAIALGMEARRMGLRVFEPDADLGMRFRSAQRKRHEKACGTVEEKQDRYAKYQSRVDAIRRTNRRVSYNEACRKVAEEFGVHINTIKNHTVSRK